MSKQPDICDQCKKELIHNPQQRVQINGYVGNGGGILLPASFQEFDFCNGECFEAWVAPRLADKDKESSYLAPVHPAVAEPIPKDHPFFKTDGIFIPSESYENTLPIQPASRLSEYEAGKVAKLELLEDMHKYIPEGFRKNVKFWNDPLQTVSMSWRYTP